MKHWVSEEKVLEVEGGTEFLHKYFGPQEGDSGHRGAVERSGQPRWLGQSSRAATRLAQPNVAIASLHRWERSDVREEQHCSHGGWEGRLLDVTCSRKQKLSQNGGLPQVSPALGFMSYVWRELALFSTMTGLSFRSGGQAAV